MIPNPSSPDTVSPYNNVYRRDEAIVSRVIAGEMILVPIRSHVADLESIYILNETAYLAWNMFDGSHTLTEILAAITSEFDVDSRQAGEDLLELVQRLESINAIIKT